MQFWRRRLASLPPAPELPYARAFRSIAAPRFRRWTALLDAQSWARLRQRAARSRVTPTAVLLAAFSEVIATWSRLPQFTLMLTFFNRPRLSGIEHVVGDFTSLLLLGVDRRRDAFLAFATRLQRELWDALDHRHGAGMSVLRELARFHGRTTQALFPVVFTSAIGQDTTATTAPWAWLGRMVSSGSSTPQVALDHQVQEEGDCLRLTWDAIDDLFPDGVIDDMFEAYLRMLDWIVDESCPWDAMPPHLVPARQLDLIAAGNATDAPVEPSTLHGLFLRHAFRTPEHPAVIGHDGFVLSYGELERRSRAVRDWLLERQTAAAELVAVVMNKGWQQVVATLGILRAGAAYLPIDPALPDERRAYLLENGRARFLLTDRSTDAAIAWPSTCVRGVIDTWEAPADRAGADADDSTRLAYVIFTSGSTGRPKGVMIDHRGAVNTIIDLNRRFAVGARDSVFGISGLGFDLSVYDIFGTLAAGATLVLPRPDAERNPQHWFELIDQHRVTLWNSVPALFEMLCEHTAGARSALPESLRLVWMSGDWIPVALPGRARALNPRLTIVSMGGATEGSIWSILYSIGAVDPAARSIPYGRALLNQKMHVFDPELRERAHWATGDIFIGGTGVALGYWDDGEKTARQFLTHPDTGERLYRTGDLGRWLPDGNMEFLGRIDGQVKLGGVRIELGEIETALSEHADIRQCAVVARHLDNRAAADSSAASSRQLVAFIVPRQGRVPGEPELRAWLGRKLPCAMLPRRFVAVESLPLSANGKVDLSGFVVPVSADRSGDGPMTPDQSFVRSLWAEELAIDPRMIGLSDNFFDLGGSSLVVVRIAARLSDHVGRPIPVVSLFESPTVAHMALLISGTDSSEDRERDAMAAKAARRKHRLAGRRASARELG